MRKNFLKKSLLTAALAMSVLAGGANVAQAETITTTLDSINATSTSIITANPKYELSTTADPAKLQVKIGDTTYYYTAPAGAKESDLQNLVNTGSSAMTTSDTKPENYVYNIGSTYYSYNSSQLPVSGYTLTEHATQQTGDITIGDKFYSLDLKTTTFGDLSGDTSKNFNVTIPDGKTKEITVKYNSANEHDRVTSSTPLDDKIYAFVDLSFVGNGAAIYIYSKTFGDITANFINNLSLSDCGAIYNEKGTIGNITGDFINNSSTNGAAGAIYNAEGTIGNITGDFINNSAAGNGGAIYNFYGTIGNITGDFINNRSNFHGGAIYNHGINAKIGNITGDFINNHATDGGSGGAIFNQNGTIGNITGDFINNYSSGSPGGAIFNQNGTIGNITGDFINNSSTNEASGGAIANGAYGADAIIGNITGDFINNSASTNGGAIVNTAYGADAIIGNITGDFTGNYATSTSDHVYSGAIYNEATITSLTGAFTGNYAQTTSAGKYAKGGAVYNTGTITDINVDFTGNYATAQDDAYGGAIYNEGTIDNINGTFTNNYAKTISTPTSHFIASGGAIANYNGGTIKNIGTSTEYAQFTGNSAITLREENTSGGAIANTAKDNGSVGTTSTIENIYANFNNNSSTDFGGAISNISGKLSKAEIGTISGVFKENSSGGGGAIANYIEGEGNVIIGNITGEFSKNSASMGGGAILNLGVIGNTVNNSGGIGTATKHALFNENFSLSSESTGGGAIFNAGTITNIYADFGDNYAEAQDDGASAFGGAIVNMGEITNLNANFSRNYAKGTSAQGGAILNMGGEITNVNNSNFTSNYVTSTSGNAMGGAIYNDGTITNLIANFIGNSATSAEGDAYGGAIVNAPDSTMTISNSLFYNNNANGTYALGGAIYNATNSTMTISNSGFYNNNAVGTDAYGGAIYNSTDAVMTIKNTTFSGNTANGVANDIYNAGTLNILGTTTPPIAQMVIQHNMLTGATPNIPLSATFIGSGISGNGRTKIGDGTTPVTLMLGKDATFEQNEVFLNKATLDLQNGSIDEVKTKTIAVNSDNTFKLDFDPTATTQKLDKITAIEMGADDNSTIKAESINIVNEATSNGTLTGVKWFDVPDFMEDFATDTTQKTGTATNGHLYTFNPNGAGILDITIGDAITLPEAVHEDTYNYVTVYSTNQDIKLNDSLGDLSGTNRNFSIFGNGKTIDADGSYAGVNVLAGQTLTIDNATMKNFNKMGNGGVVNNAGSVADINGIFTNNSASDSGGVINNEGTITNIKGTFTDNNALGNGGVINNLGTINNISATFKNNLATVGGGGAIFNNDENATINITNSTFDSNRTTGAQGGAIEVNLGKVAITNTTFTKNEANTHGGAIDVREEGQLTVNNSIFDNNIAHTSNGGAINSDGTIEVKNSDFTNNTSKGSEGGGAIIVFAGSATIKDSIFTGNTAAGNGGAIYNGGTLDITGSNTFTDNNAVNGGAIYNTDAITNINADFTGNYAKSTEDKAYGGAIYNQDGIINSIAGDFINNYATSESDTAQGGAIYNEFDSSGIGEITGNFINNYAKSTLGIARGGAILNRSTIGKITGDFIENYTDSESNEAYGGAIYNNNTINNITGDFINNYAKSKSNEAKGGAIYNLNATIANIAGDFINNYATSESGIVQGGAIWNSGTITLKDALFNNNYVVNNGVKTLNDIHNEGTLNIVGNVSMTGGITDNETPKGILNIGDATNVAYLKLGKDATLNQKTINFANNSTLDAVNGVKNTYTATDVSGNGNLKLDIMSNTNDDIDSIVFEIPAPNLKIAALNIHQGLSTGTTFQYASSNMDTTHIQAATNEGTYRFANSNGKLEVTATYMPDTVKSAVQDSDICSYSIVDGTTIPVDFGGDAEQASLYRNFTIYGNGGTIDGGQNAGIKVELAGTLEVNDTTFQNFNSTANGGVINNQGGKITNITGAFKNNTTTGSGGAIHTLDGSINNINADFSGNKASYGGAINIEGDIKNITGKFENNSATEAGGAINIVESDNPIEISNATFTGNKADGAGGAIANESELIISNSTFKNNTANGKPNDIMNAGLLTFKGDNTLEGGITDIKSIDETEENVGKTTIGDGSTKTTVTLGNNATLQQKEVVLNNNAMLALGSRAAADFMTNVGTFTVNGGSLSTQNNSIGELGFNSLILNGDLNLYVDADLANKTMDTIDANTVSGSGMIHVAGINLLSDANEFFTTINFTSNTDLKSRIDYTGESILAYSPTYKYFTAYNPYNADFMFLRMGDGGIDPTPDSTVDNYNPAILAGSVAQQGMYMTQINTYEQAFANMDMMMLMTKEQRTAMKNANKTAADATKGVVTYSPNQIPEQDKGMWFRPFASFENVGLKDGPDVDNISYGGLIGADSDLIELSHGWDFVWGGYAGYNGSHQHYEGIGIYQNGGTLGLNATWYKDNFFTGLTANVGASVADANTMYGREDMTMLATGVASKTGYNWELLNSRLIVQPSFLMSYSFINTFNYTNAAGVDISSDPLNAIQIVPGLKFIGNLPNGWQPYIGVQMIWNIMDKTKFSAGDVGLSEMSVDPYVQYGVGLQKRWGDRFTGFGQVMLRNGGRTGVSLNAGFRWALGQNGPKSDSKAGVKKGTERNISLTTK